MERTRNRARPLASFEMRIHSSWANESFCSLRRLHPKKGLHLLIQAWARLSTKVNDVHLVIAGPDSDGCGRPWKRRQTSSSSILRYIRRYVTGEHKWSAPGGGKRFRTAVLFGGF